MKRGAKDTVVILVVGAVIGSILGEILGHVFTSSLAQTLFTRGTSLGISPFTVHLLAFELTLGFLVRVNLCTLVGIVVAFLYLRK